MAAAGHNETELLTFFFLHPSSAGSIRKSCAALKQYRIIIVTTYVDLYTAYATKREQEGHQNKPFQRASGCSDCVSMVTGSRH